MSTIQARLRGVIGAVLMAALAMFATGCTDSYCLNLPALCQQNGTAGAGGSAGMGGAGMGGDAGAPLNCDPTGPVDLAQVPECGVCVSSAGSDTTGDGTKYTPYGTFSKALEDIGAQRASKPWRKHVYACSFNNMPFVEAVKLSSEVMLHGALDCTSNNNWVHDPDPAKRTLLTAPADTIPLTVEDMTTGVEILDFSIMAADASVTSGSSIAVMVSDGAASFTRCDLIAGEAHDGTAGDFTGAPAVDADPGGDGKNAGGTAEGGTGAVNMYCDRSGGDGGNGGLAPNGDGSGGSIGDPAMKEGGAGGPGNSSTPGGAGTDGMTGDDGAGASGSGTIGASGYSGVTGGEAKVGARGTSGGGGGGSKATSTVNGTGGGGGGVAGCGGNPGHGGTAGGSSIALVSVNAMVTMNACALYAGKGGGGGKGSKGQTGQNGGKAGKGGAGGNGVGSGADGGKGGKGGDGGDGGGGLGGHSLGIAATGTAPQLTATACKMGATGTGGDGGNMTPANMNPGADGHAAACWDFDMDMPCMDVDCPAQ